ARPAARACATSEPSGTRSRLRASGSRPTADGATFTRPAGCTFELAMMTRRAPAAPLAGRVTGYYGFEVATPQPVRRREGPGADVVVILTFEEHWLIDGERQASFVAGLHERQVT